MNERRLPWVTVVAATICALLSAQRVQATGVPIAGFAPLVGLSLTDEFKDEDNPNIFFQADLESSLVGTQFGTGGTPFYDVALIDTGAAASLITTAADASYDIQGAGFRGTHELQLGGATGFLFATINDPMAMFATGLGNRTGTAPLTLNTSTMKGQSSVSILTLPPESDLPNIVGIPFASQYATYIRNDLPQIFQQGGRTVRAPQIEFLPLGSGGQGIVRRAPMELQSGTAFSAPPVYVFDFDNLFNGLPLTENPTAPTVLQEPGAMFLNVNVNNNGNSLNNFQFFFDTGADVTVVSELNAVRLGFDPILDTPDFTIAVVGSAGVTENVPGFFCDQLTIQAVGGSVTATNVPVVVLDVTNPADPGNVVDGIIGTNILSGRNLVIDPKPSLGGGGVGPSLYISDPVTTGHNWATAAASGNWATTTNWNAAGTPDSLWVANVGNVSGSNQEAVVSADSTVWEVNVSGTASATMTVRVQSGVRLTTFSGVNLETGGNVRLDGGTLDTHFVDIRGGTLTGAGSVMTGSGPIPGQVENHNGTVAPGNSVGTLGITGRFANSGDGTLAFDLGGLTAGSQYDQLIVTGAAALDGTLAVSLFNLGGGLFTPSVGNTFTLLTATEGVGGTFDALLLPGGFQWNVAYGANNVVLSVIGLSPVGDYNADGTVNAADYVVWRNSLGATGANLPADGNGDLVVNQTDYEVWRSHFGMTSGSGLASSVPEPASAILFALVACGLALCRKRLTPRVRCAASTSCAASTP